MNITHVIRGDDHVNNTPRQINIMRALGGTPPVYAHLPTVLNELGEKMSKRNGAMSVRDYQKAGYLPEAILNYLARLGWSHGDAEVFTKEQFVNWFDLHSLGRSPAQHNPEKLLWLNHQYIQNADPVALAKAAKPFAHDLGIDTETGPDFVEVVTLLKDRANTLVEIAESAKLFYLPAPMHQATDIAANIPQEIVPAIQDLILLIKNAEHSKTAYGAAFKEVLAKHQIKMPALAMPVRYALFATTQTPAIDSVLVVLGKDEAVTRLSKVV
jgi:glutamyl-tRNA synthetase